MNVTKMTDQLSVTGQIEIADLAAIKAQGFATVISNRPDGETDDQPSFADIAQAARAVGLQAKHVPVISGEMTDADVKAFAAALEGCPGPALAFCRSGTRSTALWTRMQAV